MGSNHYARRRYPCGCHHIEATVLERAPAANHHGPAVLIHHRAWGDHNPNRVHENADRTEVRARETDRWPTRC